jgi:restriction system protein
MKFVYTFDELFNPVLSALRALGGSGTNQEIEDEVISSLELSEPEVNDLHRGSTTKINYRLRWARNYLKHYGLVENPSRAVWALTPKGLKTAQVEREDVNQFVRALTKANNEQERPRGQSSSSDLDGIDPSSDDLDQTELLWRDELLNTLKKLSPSGFEDLSKRLLRELGFNDVEVTGKSNDGGIDGHGGLKIGSVITFHVAFQCKRYKDSVGSEKIREFRGSVLGKADKGLMITTGRFTREARKEAQRDGAFGIDLIDGDELVDRLKDLRLGVKVETVEQVEVDPQWFFSRFG